MFSDEGGWATWVCEMFYGVGGRAARVREMFLDGGYGATSAALGKCFPTFSLSSFLSLMKEKRAKENQGARGTCQVCRVQKGGGVVFSEIGRVREGGSVVFSEVGWVRGVACVVFSDGGEWTKKIPAKRLDGGDLRKVADDGMDYEGDSVSGAFRSKMERRM